LGHRASDGFENLRVAAASADVAFHAGKNLGIGGLGPLLEQVEDIHVLGIRSRDCSGSYRCYRIAKMPADLDKRMISTGYSYLEEILFRCQRAGMVLGEVPITFEERRRGKSKISWKEAVRAVARDRLAQPHSRKPTVKISRYFLSFCN
jgi:hypothetical protein